MPLTLRAVARRVRGRGYPCQAFCPGATWTRTQTLSTLPNVFLTPLPPHGGSRARPEDAPAHTAPGRGLMDISSIQSSVAKHQIAIELNPNSALAHWAFGYGLHRAERLAGRVQHWVTTWSARPSALVADGHLPRNRNVRFFGAVPQQRTLRTSARRPGRGARSLCGGLGVGEAEVFEKRALPPLPQRAG